MIKLIIENQVKKFINESAFSYQSIPADIKKTLEDEYFHLLPRGYDYNEKLKVYQNDIEAFKEFILKEKEKTLFDNIDRIISAIRKDLILLKRKKAAKAALDGFEQLIKPALGDEVLLDPISKYMERVLMSSHDLNEIRDAFNDAKNIMDEDGSIDYEKIEQSDIFDGDIISVSKFEKFAGRNPEYQGVFNDWKKMFYDYIELSDEGLNAYRGDSVGYKRLRKLYDYLVGLKRPVG